MAEPIFNIVRRDNLDDQGDQNIDYVAASPAINQKDEVLLVDDLGMPCAFPSAQGYDDVDARHDFAGGGVGQSKVRHRHRIQMMCDGLSGSARRKLREMMRDRADVLFTPGFGRHTELAYRPAEYDAYDLTGRHALTRSGDADQNAVWDAERGVMMTFDSGDGRIIPTPAGAGEVFEGTLNNCCDIPTPSSGSLWTNSGGGTAVEYKANAFGQTDAPHACRCYTTAYSTGQLYYVGVTPSSYGVGVFTVSMMIRGSLPGTWYAQLYDNTNTASLGQYALDGDYGDWTKVTFNVPCDTTGSSDVVLRVYRSSGGRADFEVGPVAVYWTEVAGQYYYGRGEWHASGARTADYVYNATTFPFPDPVTHHVSFWLPEDYDLSTESEMIGFFGSPAGIRDYDLVLFAYNSVPRLRVLYYYGHATIEYAITAYVDTLLVPGAVNTITVTLGQDAGTVYVNGVAAGDSSNHPDEYLQRKKPSVGDQFDIGRTNYYAAYSHTPLLSYRCERAVWSADRVAWEHATSANPGALEATVPARGRYYKIRQIPSSPSSNAGDATWSGILELEQSDYTQTLADITAKE